MSHQLLKTAENRIREGGPVGGNFQEPSASGYRLSISWDLRGHNTRKISMASS